MGNAFHALDGVYFATPGSVRRSEGFLGKMIVRVELDVEIDSDEDEDAYVDNDEDRSTRLSITDLGVGMTRADLINVFGVGAVSTNSGGNNSSNLKRPDCTSSNIGGFYAAFCSLASSCVISTKSKFDDYYEFEICEPHTHFTITKTLKQDGQVPLVENGFDQFSDVRGECGTRVTFVLKPEASAVLKKEEHVRDLLAHIFETSQYNAVFRQDGDAMRIVQKDQDMIDQLAQSAVNDPSNMEDFALDGCLSDVPAAPIDVLERSKYIPVRLSLAERKMLRLVDAAMHCCDYTNVVDVPYKSQHKRMHALFKGITSILNGVVLACDYQSGQKLLSNKSSFSDFEKFFRQLFEITRRHKIMNPEKMRTEYGKFMYFLQDTIANAEDLDLDTVKPIESVYKFLEANNGLDLLKDAVIVIATSEVLAQKKSRAQINLEIKKKERAVNHLKQKYKSSKLSADDIHLCLYSICDNDSFLNSNRLPIDTIITYLKEYFKPGEVEEGFSLSIVSGENGARLSHSHERQYYFALQSLTLWRDIIHEMFYLWHLAEEDLLSESVGYKLKDTGQGMQRVQPSPRTYRAMQGILRNVQQKVNQWVGSSVIHMGGKFMPYSSFMPFPMRAVVLNIFFFLQTIMCRMR